MRNSCRFWWTWFLKLTFYLNSQIPYKRNILWIKTSKHKQTKTLIKQNSKTVQTQTKITSFCAQDGLCQSTTFISKDHQFLEILENHNTVLKGSCPYQIRLCKFSGLFSNPVFVFVYTELVSFKVKQPEFLVVSGYHRRYSRGSMRTGSTLFNLRL